MPAAICRCYCGAVAGSPYQNTFVVTCTNDFKGYVLATKIANADDLLGDSGNVTSSVMVDDGDIDLDSENKKADTHMEMSMPWGIRTAIYEEIMVDIGKISR